MSIGPIPAPQLAAAGPGKQPENPSKIRDAATQFEALLLTQMLRSARAGDAPAESMGGGDGSGSSLVELGEQQVAQALASSGGLGIAKIVIAGLDSHANR